MRITICVGGLLAFMGLSQSAPLAIQGGWSSSVAAEDLDAPHISFSINSECLGIHSHEKGADPASASPQTTIINIQKKSNDVNKGSSAIESRQVTLNMILGWFENAGITLKEVLEDHGLLHAK